jgi:hypothetical protein
MNHFNVIKFPLSVCVKQLVVFCCNKCKHVTTHWFLCVFVLLKKNFVKNLNMQISVQENIDLQWNSCWYITVQFISNECQFFYNLHVSCKLVKEERSKAEEAKSGSKRCSCWWILLMEHVGSNNESLISNYIQHI